MVVSSHFVINTILEIIVFWEPENIPLVLLTQVTCVLNVEEFYNHRVRRKGAREGGRKRGRK